MAGSAGRGLQGERGGGNQAPRYNLLELDRKVTNLLRIGRVIDCDYPNGKVRVQFGESENRRGVTWWINWMCRNAAYDRAGDETPELNEQVLVYCPSGRLEQARVLMRLRRLLHPLPSTDPNDAIKLYRILENTLHWTALERKRMVGDVNPEEKRANAAEPVHTIPPQDKVLNSEVEVAEALEYWYQIHTRPELLAVMEFVSMVTQPNADAFVKLVSNAMDSGSAEALVEAAIRGDGDSRAFFRSLSGDSTFDTETNPNKPYERGRTGGNAYTFRETRVLNGGGNAEEHIDTATESGDATSREHVHTPDGQAYKEITIDGANSELIINVRNTAHLRINVGESGQYIDMDGQDIEVHTPANAEVVAGGNVDIDAGGDATVVADGSINLEAPSINIDASGALSITAGTTTISTGSLAITQGG